MLESCLWSDDVKNTTLSRPLDAMLEMVKVSQMNLEKVVLMAMEKEKKSFRLYMDLLAVVSDADCRETIMSIAEEEPPHKISFELEYDRLTAKRQQNQ